MSFSRRDLLKGAGGLALGLGAREVLGVRRGIAAEPQVGAGKPARTAAGSGAGGYYREPARDIPVARDVDVLVVGGGMAGVCAASAAGRMGAKTLLVEYFGCLGGNATTGMVNNFCGYTTMGRGRIQIVKGTGGRIHEKLLARHGVKSIKSFTFNPEILKVVLDGEMAEAGVECLFYTQMVAPLMEKNAVGGVVVENKGGRQAIRAARVIDCTGDGDVCASAGVPFEMGDGKGGFQGCDMAFQLVNVGDDFDPAAVGPLAAEAMKSERIRHNEAPGHHTEHRDPRRLLGQLGRCAVGGERYEPLRPQPGHHRRQEAGL